MKLDIGCWNNKKRGFLGIDIEKNLAADVVCNATVSLPFKDSSFSEIYCAHFLEHVENPMNIVREIIRIAKPGAKITIKVPHFSSCIAYLPTHVYRFSLLWFYFISRTNEFEGKVTVNGRLNRCVTGDPDNEPKGLSALMTRFINGLSHANPTFCERVWCYWFGGFDEIEVTIEKI